jgi:hypothetical protein
MQQVSFNPNQSDKPQILVREVFHRDDPMTPVGFETIDFIPGAIIERCGKRYELQANGSQKRLKYLHD